MEIKDMQAFYTVVEEGNISHAALRLAVAQPALSRQMKRLETSLGVQLFERGSRRIRLTEAGMTLARDVRQKADSALQQAGQGLSEEMRRDMYQSLDIIAGNMKEICEKLT